MDKSNECRLYCCECQREVTARLASGWEVYPHREDLKSIPFWKCRICGNFVGCHHKTKQPTRPLGCIPNQEMKNARKHIHKILDPLWKNEIISRKDLYLKISRRIGWSYHTAELKTIEEARRVYCIVKELAGELM